MVLGRNAEGGAILAPPWNIDLNENAFAWRQDPAHNIPLLLIGVGRFGEAVLKRFRHLAKFHRSGFSWASDQILGLIIVPDQQNLYELDGFFVKVSLDYLDQVEKLLYKFINGRNVRCGIISDINDEDFFSVVEELLLFLDSNYHGRNLETDLITKYSSNRITIRRQSARLRAISVWQQQGRYSLEHDRDSALVNRVFYISPEATEEETLDKAALSLYTIFHSRRFVMAFLEGHQQKDKNLIINLRAIETPFDELIKYEALRLLEELLFDEQVLFSRTKNLNEQVLSSRDDVLGFYREATKHNFGHAKTIISEYLINSRDEQKWEKAALVTNWCGRADTQNYQELDRFIRKNNVIGTEIDEHLENAKDKIRALLVNRSENSVLRWHYLNAIDGAIESMNRPLFSDDQLDAIKNEFSQTIGYVVDDGQIPFLLWNPTGNQENVRIDLESLQPLIEDFVDVFRKLIQEKLESVLIRNLDAGLPLTLTIDNSACDFLVNIPEAISGRKDERSFFLVSEQFNPANRLHRIHNLELINTSESGLALTVLLESVGSYRNHPGYTDYRRSDIEHRSLKNAYNFERDFFGWDHEFSTRTLLCLINLRATELFFKALATGIIRKDLHDNNWYLLFPDDERIPLFGNEAQRDKTVLSSLYDAYRFFCIEGIDHKNAGSQRFNRMMYEKTLDKIEGLLETKEQNRGVWDEIARQAESSQEQLLDARREQEDLIYLYKRINNVD